MKLYFFEAGILKTQKQFLTAGVDVGKPFEVPVPFLLIDHPKGKILFDTGLAYETIHNKLEHWGEAIVSVYNPVMTEEQWCVNAIQNVGCAPEDIDLVILSHLHLDHAGCIGQFPNAKYLVQRDELHYAYVPDSYMKGAYIRKDFDKEVDWVILEGWQDDRYDLFGDGSIIIYFTPGHSPGHQSILVNLPNSGSMFFAADSCYTQENLDQGILPGLMWSAYETEKTVNRIKNFIQDLNGAKIITGHDPEAWKEIKQAPEYYD
jgi:glyoxylase-like metal-dependent hydrolase (beta-lactamase superfamily II)